MVYLFTECGTKFGYGHLMRCIALYDEIVKQGQKARLIINSDQNLAEIIEDRDFEIECWYHRVNQYCLQNEYAIIDSYHAQAETYNLISRTCKKTLYLDDMNRMEYPLGIIVNPCIGANHIAYKRKENQQYLLGTDYVILRRDFVQCVKFDRKIEQDVTNVLIMLGGADIKKITPLLLKCLNHKEYDKIHSHVVVGNGFTNIEEIEREVKKENITLYKNLNSGEVCNLMKHCDFAITAAGQTINEMIAMKLPFVCIQVIDNQKYNVQALLEFNIVKDVFDASKDFFTDDFMDWTSQKVKEQMALEKRNEQMQKQIKLEMMQGSFNIIKELLR